MSASKSQKKGEGEEREGGSAYYVYCVGEGAALQPFLEKDTPAAIESSPTTNFILVSDAELSAVASPVPLADYGEDALSARLEDATWTAIRAMRHERVVEFFAREASVVPLRFGAIYLDRARIKRMLAERRESLIQIIERLRGREEWGVNVYCDRQKLLETIVTSSPRLRELSAQAERARPGQGYLIRKKIEAMRADEARAEAVRVAGEIENILSEASDGAARLRVLKDEASEHGDTIAKIAFLVERPRFKEFRAAAERLAEEQARAGFRIELTGPWPAYNFTEQR